MVSDPALQKILPERLIELSVLLHPPLQKILPERFIEPFYSIAQHSPRHTLVARQQKTQRCFEVFLGRLPDQPARRFVDEVVRVIQECIGNGEGMFGNAFADVIHGSHHGDTLFPQMIALRQFVQMAGLVGKIVFAGQLVGRGVYQVPVVDVVGAPEVQVDEVLLFPTAVVPMDHHKQRGEPALVNRVAQQGLEVAQARFAVPPFGDGPLSRNGYGPEEIAFTISAGMALEKPGKVGHPFGSAGTLQVVFLWIG